MNMQSLLKQAKQMQKEIGKAEKEFDDKLFTTQQGGGVIKISMKGNYEVASIEIQPELLSLENKEDLEILLQSSMNNLIQEITKEKEDQMKELTGGISMPGMF